MEEKHPHKAVPAVPGWCCKWKSSQQGRRKSHTWMTISDPFSPSPTLLRQKRAYLIQGLGEAVGEKQTQTKTKEQELITETYSEQAVSLSSWKAGLLTCTQLSHGNHNICSIPVGEDGLMRQPTKKPALQFFKNKRNSNCSKYVFNSYTATDVGGLVQTVTRRQQFTC